MGPPSASIRSTSARVPWRAAVAALLALALAGCGIGLVYPRLDTIGAYYVEGLVTLDDAQSLQLDRLLEASLVRHLASQLDHPGLLHGRRIITYNLLMTLKLTHLDSNGRARMVDVGNKSPSERSAIAKGEIILDSEIINLIRSSNIYKGDVLGVAQIAGFTAAKKTSDLIPLCHPIPISHATVDFNMDESLPGIEITAEVKTKWNTGVEMESLTAVSVAALTLYDMCKALSHNIRIESIHLLSKRGGKRDFVRKS